MSLIIHLCILSMWIDALKMPDKGEATMSDATLIQYLKVSLRESPDPLTIEAKIGRKAALNTSRKGGRDELRALKFETDPEFAAPKVLDLIGMKHVVFW